MTDRTGTHCKHLSKTSFFLSRQSGIPFIEEMPLSDFPSELPAWVAPPPGSSIIIFSPGYQKWLSDTLHAQHLATAELYKLLRQVVAPDVDAAANHPLLGVLQEEVSTLTSTLESVLLDLSAPRTLDIQINGGSPKHMVAVNDVSYTAHVTPKDAAGRIAADAGPFSWTADPSTAATLQEDPAHPGDTAHIMVTDQVPDAAGNQPNYTLAVSDGTLSGSMLAEPTAGAATSLSVGVD